MTSRLDTQNGNPILGKLLAERIAASPQQRITFAEYMDWVLYHPQHGYYASDQVKIGAQGDFVTSPHLGADFGELLAEQLADMWRALGQPQPFTLVEMGAGQGLLIQDILRHLHRHHFECFDSLEYIIIEKSAALIAEQRQRLQSLMETWGRLSWRTWEDIEPDSIVGCCFSNELPDAFPVHQVLLHQGELKEIYVTVARSEGDPEASSRFVEVVGDLSTPELARYFDRVGVEFPSEVYPDGYRTEVNLAALDWLCTVSDRLQRGYILTIDYGHPAARYYSPARHQGTLQCYYQHTYHSNPYIHIGRQDLTAHVDFTALEKQGERCGLQTLGFTQQGLFLMALGLGDRIAALTSLDVTQNQSLDMILRRREALHSLINPMGLGNFGVLIQGKRLGETAQNYSLKGLTIPPMQ